MCSLSHSWVITLPVRFWPWSDMMVRGRPCLEKTSNSASATSSAVADFRGIASGNLDAKSIHVRTKRCPGFGLTKGPSRSMATFSNGMVSTGTSTIGALGALYLHVLWHMSQLRHHCTTSWCILGHRTHLISAAFTFLQLSFLFQSREDRLFSNPFSQ